MPARRARSSRPVAPSSFSVRVNARAAARLRSGHPWVYRSDLDSEIELPRGEVVQITDERDRILGYALSSSSSQIALRMISERECSTADLPRIVAERIRSAIAYRERIGIPKQSNAYRLVFSEADQLPGLIVDRYNDVLAFQVLTQAMDRAEVRSSILETLTQQLQPAGIVERVETRIRELEDLAPIAGGLIAGDKSKAIVQMNASPALRFHYDALAGQKT